MKLASDPADYTRDSVSMEMLQGDSGWQPAYSLNASTKGRAGRVSNFEIRHAEIRLLLEEVRGETVGLDTSGQLFPDLVHELRV